MYSQLKHVFSLYVSTQKWTDWEQGGPNRIEWTNVDQIRTNG